MGPAPRNDCSISRSVHPRVSVYPYNGMCKRYGLVVFCMTKGLKWFYVDAGCFRLEKYLTNIG